MERYSEWGALYPPRLTVSPFYNLLLQSGFNADEFRKFQHELLLSGRVSIDAFLEASVDFIRIGKATLAVLLAQNEQEAKLYNPISGENWYQYLLETWLREADSADLTGEKIRFITYNYDRSLEFYLHNAIQRLLPKETEQKRTDVFSSFRICHVHGLLDDPIFTTGFKGRAYKPIDNEAELNRAIDKIAVIHEYGTVKDNYPIAHQMLTDSNSVVFLGFGFHAANLKRLNVRSNIPGSTVVYGSTLGLTDSEVLHQLREISTGPNRFVHKGNGQGKRFLEDNQAVKHLKLRETTTFGNGTVILTYSCRD